METMVAYVDDAEYALKIISPLLSAKSAQPANQTSHWIVVACPPEVTNDVGKWVGQDAKELWREDWASPLFAQVTQLLTDKGNTVSTQIADPKVSFVDLSNDLSKQHGGAKVLDARRPKFGQDMQPVTSEQPKDNNKLAGLAVAVTVATVLAADF